MGLKKLIARRIILTVPVLIGAATILFAVCLLLTPTMKISMYVSSVRDMRRENIKNLIHEAGLDLPIPVQYLNWLRKLAILDFGVSSSSAPYDDDEWTMSLVLARLPPTLELMLYSAPLIILLGVSLGTKAALNHNKKLDHIARFLGTTGSSIPVFLIAEVLIAIFLAQFNFYPASAGGLDYHIRYNLILRIQNGTFTQYTQMTTIDALLNGDIPLFVDAAKHLVFPVGILVFTQTAVLMKVTRAGLIEESDKMYFMSAMTRGLSRKQTIYKHARKNALISVMTISGLLLGNMLTGLAVVETVFNIPGFASLAARSAVVLDTSTVFACTTIVVLVYILLNLVVDILYLYVDPRIEL